MLFSAAVDSVLVVDGDYHLVAEWSLADEFARAQNPKGREQLDIHLDCHELPAEPKPSGVIVKGRRHMLPPGKIVGDGLLVVANAAAKIPHLGNELTFATGVLSGPVLGNK